jgi:DNA-binding IclR family transcriptional regulator
MASAPSQAFTMSELVKLTGTNVASCHAILAVLVNRGYLTRHPVHKTYRLAATLVAIGDAIAGNDPLLASARAATAEIAAQTGMETMLTGRAGSDLVAVARVAKSRLSRPSLRVGQRVPFRPPLGSTFCAWADDKDVEAWIARGDDAGGKTAAGRHRAALALVRERGFLVTLKSPEHAELKRVVSNPPAAKQPGEGRRVGELIRALGHAHYQPERLERAKTYDIEIISAPIFDAYGAASYALTVSGFAEPVRGDAIERHASQLMQICAHVMQENHIRTPGR